MSNFTVTILRLLVIFGLVLTAKKQRKATQAYYIVRVCVQSSTRTRIACLGVYVNPRWIVASVHCKRYFRNLSTVELYMGTAKMDCRNGQLRDVKRLQTSKALMFLQPEIPFTLSPQVSTVGYLKKRKINDLNCLVFCSNKIVASKNSNDTEGGCGKYLKGGNFTLVSCNRKMQTVKKGRRSSQCNHTQVAVPESGNSKEEKKCGSIVETSTPCEVKNFDTSMSPIICDYKLAGFVAQGTENPYKIKFEHIHNDLEVIENITSVCCG